MAIVMQCSSNPSQMVHAHDEHWWHSSFAWGVSPQISWLEYDWDHSFSIRSGSISTSINTHFCSLHHVLRHLHSVCLSSDRISLHSSMSSQWLSVTSLIRWAISPRPSFSPYQPSYHACKSTATPPQVPGLLWPLESFSGCTWRSPLPPLSSVRKIRSRFFLSNNGSES